MCVLYISPYHILDAVKINLLSANSRAKSLFYSVRFDNAREGLHSNRCYSNHHHPPRAISRQTPRHLAPCMCDCKAGLIFQRDVVYQIHAETFQSESHPDWIRWLQFSSTFQCVRLIVSSKRAKNHLTCLKGSFCSFDYLFVWLKPTVLAFKTDWKFSKKAFSTNQPAKNRTI